jgi:hypothetical protein
MEEGRGQTEKKREGIEGEGGTATARPDGDREAGRGNRKKEGGPQSGEFFMGMDTWKRQWKCPGFP